MVGGEAEDAAVREEEEEERSEEGCQEVEEEEEEESSVGCDFCGDLAAAAVYCRADAARLCLRCDRDVHAANAVSARHPRSLLCDACAAAPAAFLLPLRSPLRRRSGSGGRVLCSNCDFEAASRHRGRRVVERRAVESYSGCPSAAELAAMLGVGGDEKAAAGGRGVGGGLWWGGEEEDGWAWAAAAAAAAEAAPVFSMEDLIVPTTSSHGFQALGTPPLPKSHKNRESTCGKRREEILRQLQELTKSDAVISTVSEELEPVAGFQSWASEDAFRQGYAGPDIGGDIMNIVVPIYEDSKWNLKEYQNPAGTLPMEFPCEQYPIKSAEATVLSLVEISDICAGAGNETVSGDGSGRVTSGKIAQISPSKVRHDLPCPDRDFAISRYKEKRKTRRYEKLIRYESRKARADSRLRIKGRFAKGESREK